MSQALPGEHLCLKHQGNHSHYAEENCTICTLERKVLALSATKRRAESAAADARRGSDMTDDQLRKLWKDAGGSFHGPNIETGSMPEALLLPLLRKLVAKQEEPKGRNTPIELLRELFFLRMPTGFKLEEMLIECGHDDLWRRIQLCLDPSIGGGIFASNSAGSVMTGLTITPKPPAVIDVTGVVPSPGVLLFLQETNSTELPKAYNTLIKRIVASFDLYDPVDHVGSDDQVFEVNHTSLRLSLKYRYAKGTIYIDGIEVKS